MLSSFYQPLLWQQLALSPVPANQTWHQGWRGWDITEEGWALRAGRRALRWQGTGQSQKVSSEDAPSPKDKPLLPSLVGNRRQSRTAQPSPGSSLCGRQVPSQGQLLSHRADTRQDKVKPYSLFPLLTGFRSWFFSYVSPFGVYETHWPWLAIKSHLLREGTLWVVSSLKELSGWSEAVNYISECGKECKKKYQSPHNI